MTTVPDCDQGQFRKVNSQDIEWTGAVVNSVLLGKPIEEIQNMVKARIVTEDSSEQLKINCNKLHVCKSLLKFGQICRMHRILLNCVTVHTSAVSSTTPAVDESCSGAPVDSTPRPPPPSPRDGALQHTVDTADTADASQKYGLEDALNQMSDQGRHPVSFMSRQVSTPYVKPILMIKDSVVKSVIASHDPAGRMLTRLEENPADESMTRRDNGSDQYVVLHPNTPLADFTMRFLLVHHRFNIIKYETFCQFVHCYMFAGGLYDPCNRNILIADEELFKVTKLRYFHISELGRLINRYLIAADNRGSNDGEPNLDIGYTPTATVEDFSDLQLYLHPLLYQALRGRNIVKFRQDTVVRMLDVKSFVWRYTSSNEVTNTIRSFKNTPLYKLTNIDKFHYIELEWVCVRMTFPLNFNDRWCRLVSVANSRLPLVGNVAQAESARLTRMSDGLQVDRLSRGITAIVEESVAKRPRNVEFLKHRDHYKMSHFCSTAAVDKVMVPVNGSGTLGSFSYECSMKLYSAVECVSQHDINGGLNIQQARPLPRLYMAGGASVPTPGDRPGDDAPDTAAVAADGCVTDNDPRAVAGPSRASPCAIDLRAVWDSPPNDNEPEEEVCPMDLVIVEQKDDSGTDSN